MNKKKVFLLMLVISVILIIALISKVYAAQTLDVTDYLKDNLTASSQDKVPSNADEYEELEDETKTDEEKKEEQTDKKEENKEQDSNKADDDKKTEDTNKTEGTQENVETENKNNDNSANIINGQHATTGVFNNVIYISAGIISLLLIVLAYNKLKKYNY